MGSGCREFLAAAAAVVAAAGCEIHFLGVGLNSWAIHLCCRVARFAAAADTADIGQTLQVALAAAATATDELVAGAVPAVAAVGELAAELVVIAVVLTVAVIVVLLAPFWMLAEPVWSCQWKSAGAFAGPWLGTST